MFEKIFFPQLRKSLEMLQINWLLISIKLSAKVVRYLLNVLQECLSQAQFHVLYFASEYVINVQINY